MRIGGGAWTAVALSQPPHSCCPLHTSPWGCGQGLCHSLRLSLITSQGGLGTSGERSPPGTTRFSLPRALLNHALSLLKICPELRNLKEALIKGNGKKNHTIRRREPHRSVVLGLQSLHLASFGLL